MGLREIIAKGVDAAFAGMGNIPVALTVTHYTSAPVRNMTTGAYTRTSVNYSCTGAFVDLKKYEGRADLLVGDKLVIVRRNQVLFADIGDVVTDNSLTYDVINVNSDPVEATYELHIRRKKVVIT